MDIGTGIIGHLPFLVKCRICIGTFNFYHNYVKIGKNMKLSIVHNSSTETIMPRIAPKPSLSSLFDFLYFFSDLTHTKYHLRGVYGTLLALSLA
jgi:hypothetical protein